MKSAVQLTLLHLNGLPWPGKWEPTWSCLFIQLFLWQSREESKKQALAAKREKRKEKRKKKKEEQKRKQEEEEGQKTKEDLAEMQEQKENSADGIFIFLTFAIKHKITSLK